MKKTLVAHLGAHKTATSLVQKYFKAKTKYYRKQGIQFLSREQVSPYISWGDKIVKNGDKFRDYLNEQAAKTTADHLMFSNENILGRPFPDREGLYPNHEPIVKSLKAATGAFNTKIVYGIRPQVDFLQSYYLQRVHQGDFMTFNQFLDEIDLDTISWRPMIECLQDTFGKDNVIVLDFSLIKMGQNKFIQHFLDVSIRPGIVIDEDYDEVHNPSISDRGLHLALRINPLLRKGETGNVRRFLQTYFSNQTEPRPVLMSESVKADLNARYDAEYQDLITK